MRAPRKEGVIKYMIEFVMASRPTLVSFIKHGVRIVQLLLPDLVRECVDKAAEQCCIMRIDPYTSAV